MPEWENARVPVPEGAYPLFLTNTTQANFKCREREDCTSAQPYVFVSKKVFLDDIQFRGVISDFHPTKKYIEKYPDGVDVQEDGTSGLLLVWDEDEDYGQNFYLVHSVELKEAVVAKWAAAGEGDAAGESGGAGAMEEEEEEAYVPPVSKPWVSLGSEQELENEAVVEGRGRFILHLSRARRLFGAKPRAFFDRDADADPCISENDCRPFTDLKFGGLVREDRSVGVQAVPLVAPAATQTNSRRQVNVAAQYDARELSAGARRATERSEPFRAFLRRVRAPCEQALQQNELVDITADDFAELADDETSLGKSDANLRELQHFSHLDYCVDRTIACADWLPTPKALVVGVSCVQRLSFEERVAIAGKIHTGFVLLWNFSDPITPQMVLEAPSDVLCFRFCPTNPDLVAGGLASGQTVVWDLAAARREAQELHADTGKELDKQEEGSRAVVAQPAFLSQVDLSHRAAVTDIAWLPSALEVSEKGKISRESEPGAQELFATTAADGQLLFWDIGRARELRRVLAAGGEESPAKKKKREGWGPTHRLPLKAPAAQGGAELACISMALSVPEDPAAPCELFCVTEEGEVARVSLANPGSEAAERGVTSVLPGHCSPCTALCRSPFHADVYLSVGDWSFSLWREGVELPLFSSPFASALLTCGCWSPTRPALLFVGRADGAVDVWDLNDRSHEPFLSVAVTSAAITTLHIHTAGTKQLLAVGDDLAALHVMEVPRSLRRRTNSEKDQMTSFLAREQRRVEYVQKRAGARGETASTEAAAATGEPEDEADTMGDDEPTATDPEGSEADFLAIEAAFLERMGLKR